MPDPSPTGPLLSAALDYARRGWQIIPLHNMADGVCTCQAKGGCKTPGKHPRVADWTKRGTTSGADLYEWWGTWPQANVGIVTGAASGVWCLDVDPANGGMETLARLREDYGDLPATRIHGTGSGGLHFLWDTDGQAFVTTAGKYGNALGPGLDTRAEGGMIVAPPSVSGKGPYGLVSFDCDPARPPGWLRGWMIEIGERRGRHLGDLMTVEPQPIPDTALPRKLRSMLAEIKGDGERHQWFWQMVAEGRRQNLSPGQVAAAVTPWCEAVGKFVGRVPQEVARAWARLEAETADTVIEVPGTVLPPPVALAPPQEDGERFTIPLPETGVLLPFPGPPPVWSPPEPGYTLVPPGPSFGLTDERMRLLDWPEVWDAAPDEAEWLWEPFCERGRLTVVYSLPGVGKSIWSQEGAACLAAGIAPPGAPLPQEPVNVLYVDSENAAHDVVSRLRDMGFKPDELSHLHYASFADVGALDLAGDAAQFVAWCTGKEMAVVFLDTTGQFLEGKENDVETFRYLYRYCLAPLKAAGIAVVLLDHAGKDEEKKQRGSSQKAGDPDAIWRMDTRGDGTLRLVREKDRLGRGAKAAYKVTRRADPLRHEVTEMGTPGAAIEGTGGMRLAGQVDEDTANLLDRMKAAGVKPGDSRRTANGRLKETYGRGARNDDVAQALQLMLLVDLPAAADED